MTHAGVRGYDVRGYDVHGWVTERLVDCARGVWRNWIEDPREGDEAYKNIKKRIGECKTDEQSELMKWKYRLAKFYIDNPRNPQCINDDSADTQTTVYLGDDQQLLRDVDYDKCSDFLVNEC